MERIDLDPVLRDAQELEPLPESVHRLTTLFSDEDWDLDEIALTVELDQALTGRLLRLANSAGGGARVPIDSVDAAVLREGPGLVLSLALASAVRKDMQSGCPGYGLAEEALWHHSVAAALSVEMARVRCRLDPPKESFVAALLHDVGKLVIGRHLPPDGSGELLEARDGAGRRDADVERTLLGVDHALVGARVAKSWNLPGGIPEAIAFHHRPESAPTEKIRNLASMVQLANSVAHHLGIGGPDCGPTRMTSDCVARLSISREQFDELCRGTEEELSIVLDLYR